MSDQKKLVIGWFSFSCCEDSTVMMTELMNDHWQEWVKYIDFRDAKILRSKNDRESHLDVAFIEGAVASDHQEQQIKEIRARSTKVVAIGSCACTGMPSSQRNNFDEATKQEIQFLVDKFKLNDRVKKLEDIIIVDMKVPGCPMNTDLFLTVVNSLLREFKII
jgi:sulfhydrogenase subunit delta